MRGKSFTGLLLLALASLFLISAKTVVRWVNLDVDDHIILPANSDENPCDFDIDWGFKGSEFVIVNWDEDGYFKIIDVMNKIDETYSANGKSLLLKGITYHTQLISENEMVTSWLGVSGFAVIPGYGPVWGNTGNTSVLFVYDPDSEEWIATGLVKEVGNIQYDDFSPICEYLSP
jgi:hypothetical protein